MDFDELFPYLLSKSYTDEIAVKTEGDIDDAIQEAKDYADSIASKIEWKKEIVETFPDPSVADPHTLYFVPASVTPEQDDITTDEYGQAKTKFLKSGVYYIEEYATIDGYIEYMFFQETGRYEAIGRTTAEYVIDEETLNLENNVLSIKYIPLSTINNLFNVN